MNEKKNVQKSTKQNFKNQINVLNPNNITDISPSKYLLTLWNPPGFQIGVILKTKIWYKTIVKIPSSSWLQIDVVFFLNFI